MAHTNLVPGRFLRDSLWFPFNNFSFISGSRRRKWLVTASTFCSSILKEDPLSFWPDGSGLFNIGCNHLKPKRKKKTVWEGKWPEKPVVRYQEKAVDLLSFIQLRSWRENCWHGHWQSARSAGRSGRRGSRPHILLLLLFFYCSICHFHWPKALSLFLKRNIFTSSTGSHSFLFFFCNSNFIAGNSSAFFWKILTIWIIKKINFLNIFFKSGFNVVVNAVER